MPNVILNNNLALESDLWHDEIADVHPLNARHQRVAQSPKVVHRFKPSQRQLPSVSFADPLFPADPDDIVSQYVGAGHDPKMSGRLKHGYWPIDYKIDLHGLRSEEANWCVARALEQMHARGARCLLVVHGKGLSSQQGVPVLKHKLQFWLKQRPEVIAFTEAGIKYGGSGAMLVLLSRGLVHHV